MKLDQSDLVQQGVVQMKILNFMNDEMMNRYDVLYPIEYGYIENGRVICSKWRARRRLVIDWFFDVWMKGLSAYSLKKVEE